MVLYCKKYHRMVLHWPNRKNRDTRRWLCARGKHTATCDCVASFYFNTTKMNTLDRLYVSFNTFEERMVAVLTFFLLFIGSKKLNISRLARKKLRSVIQAFTVLLTFCFKTSQKWDMSFETFWPIAGSEICHSYEVNVAKVVYTG